jgi:hypothetical protein
MRQKMRWISQNPSGSAARQSFALKKSVNNSMPPMPFRNLPGKAMLSHREQPQT